MSWQLDTGHTYIGFTGRHLMVSTVRGEFELFSGSVEFDENARFLDCDMSSGNSKER